MRLPVRLLLSMLLIPAVGARGQSSAPNGGLVLTGQAAEAGWRSAAPGVWRLITPQDMPAPHASRSVSNAPSVVVRPAGAAPQVPKGFAITAFRSGLEGPRVVRVAPDGTIFVAESNAGRVRLMTAPDGAAHPAEDRVFARGLDRPYGIAFWPPADPHYVYVGEVNRVVRYPWRPGQAAPSGRAEIIVPQIAATTSGHWTRDLAFSPDGGTLYVAVGSRSNDGASLPDRAVVLAFDPEGGHRQLYAWGLRNCAGLAIDPSAGTPWCAVDERDGLGNTLPPDYATHVRQGGFYGWPWYYIGDHPDPDHVGERPDLGASVVIPDVLLEAHSAPLGLAFYAGAATRAGPAAFPRAYQGSLFVTLHGSWNRAERAGYKLVRIPPGSRSYEDFVTGFVVDSDSVWGRPVGVAVAHDGALLMSDDASGTLWRIAPDGTGG